MKKGRINIGLVAMIVLISVALIQTNIESASGAEQQAIDLTQAVIITPQNFSGPENKAVQMLIEEVERRTQLRWERSARTISSSAGATITINRAANSASLPREGYKIQTT